jgi:hypothetical protein
LHPKYITMENDAIENVQRESLENTLELVQQYLEKEIDFKQKMIVRQQHEIDALKKELDTSKNSLAAGDQKLQQSIQMNEGNKQLINKLLGDIS